MLIVIDNNWYKNILYYNKGEYNKFYLHSSIHYGPDHTKIINRYYKTTYRLYHNCIPSTIDLFDIYRIIISDKYQFILKLLGYLYLYINSDLLITIPDFINSDTIKYIYFPFIYTETELYYIKNYDNKNIDGSWISIYKYNEFKIAYNNILEFKNKSGSKSCLYIIKNNREVIFNIDNYSNILYLQDYTIIQLNNIDRIGYNIVFNLQNKLIIFNNNTFYYVKNFYCKYYLGYLDNKNIYKKINSKYGKLYIFNKNLFTDKSNNWYYVNNQKIEKIDISNKLILNNDTIFRLRIKSAKLFSS